MSRARIVYGTTGEIPMQRTKRLQIMNNPTTTPAAPSADAQKTFDTIMKALGITSTGDPAADIAAADLAWDGLLESVEPAAQKQMGEDAGLTAKEIEQCRTRRVDVRLYARNKASLRRG